MNQTVPKQLIFTYELKETKPEITLPIEEEFRFPVAEKSAVEVVQDSSKLPHEVFPLLQMKGEWALIQMDNGEERMAYTVPANGAKYLEGRKMEAFFWKGSLQ